MYGDPLEKRDTLCYTKANAFEGNYGSIAFKRAGGWCKPVSTRPFHFPSILSFQRERPVLRN